MTWDQVALEPCERSAGRDRRSDAALPFPFYDFTEWFFEPVDKPRRRPPRRPPPTVVPGVQGRAALWLFRLAGAIVRPGPRSDELARDWEAVLTESQRSEIVRHAGGMVHTALCCRVDHVVQTCWRPVDRVLESRVLSNLVVVGPSGVIAWLLVRAGGGANLLGHAEAVAIVGGVLRELVVLGRWWRDVGPPERARREERRRR